MRSEEILTTNLQGNMVYLEFKVGKKVRKRIGKENKVAKLRKKMPLFRLGLRDSLITLGILTVVTVICACTREEDGAYSHAPLLFVLAILLISRFTDSYFYGLLSSLIAVIEVNYVFTYPYFKLNFTLSGYPLTFLVMFSVSIVVSMLTTQIKQQEKIRMEIEKEKMRGNLLRAVSHDIRTPLTSIVGAASAVLENHDRLSDEKVLSLLDDIKEEAQWLVRVVENLLLVTRIDTNEAKVTKAPEMLEEIVAEALTKVKKRFPSAPMKIEVPDNLVFVPMDGMLIEQVICNLLENAMLHGGSLTEILFRVTVDEEQALFCVYDDGDGIAEELLPKLLEESLYRENDKTVDGKRNMGIGLSVCKSIISAHGGRMRAYNRKEGGAAFEFSLPMKEG